MPSDQTNASDTPASPPSVCVCGYDLSGLPDDAAAKCPECGAVVAGLTTFDRWRVRGWFLVMVMIVPFVLAVFGFAVGTSGLVPVIGPLVSIALVGLGGIGFIFVSFPVLILHVMSGYRGRGFIANFLCVVGLFGLLVMANAIFGVVLLSL